MRIELKGIRFSAAHFVIGHKKCERLHGHNWMVGVVVEGGPDKRGLVVDFMELKKILEKACKRYDHRLLLPSKNPALKREAGKNLQISVHGRKFEFPRGEAVWIPVVNTTVEELARIIADRTERELRRYPNVGKVIVTVEESEGESATEERRVGTVK